MKKKIKKLNLRKSTIANLDVTEMSQHVGGVQTQGQNCVPTQGGGPKFSKRTCNSF
jgi:natural product precursor